MFVTRSLTHENAICECGDRVQILDQKWARNEV